MVMELDPRLLGRMEKMFRVSVDLHHFGLGTAFHETAMAHVMQP